MMHLIKANGCPVLALVKPLNTFLPIPFAAGQNIASKLCSFPWEQGSTVKMGNKSSKIPDFAEKYCKFPACGRERAIYCVQGMSETITGCDATI